MSWRTRTAGSTQVQPTAAAFSGTNYGRPAAGQSAAATPAQLAQMQRQQAQYLSQQQDLYNLQQAQMALQLEAMKLQNLTIQERILSAASAQQQAEDKADRMSFAVKGTEAPSVPYGYVDQYGQMMMGEVGAVDQEETRQARRGALQHLQRAQMQRNDPVPQVAAGLNAGNRLPTNRLSFNGGNGLAERALARKAAVSSPPVAQHRHSSSSGSDVSNNSAQPGHASPDHPMLVFSEPGEIYAAPPSPIRAMMPTRPLSVKVGRPRHSGSSSGETNGSSSPSSDSDSGASEVLSFESVTSASSIETNKPVKSASVGSKLSDLATPTLGSAKTKLNPAASSFTPGLYGSPNLPSTMSTPVPFRNFSAPPVMSAQVGSVATRQPRGPVDESELTAKNFGGRISQSIRRKAVDALRLKTRSPTSPTFGNQ